MILTVKQKLFAFLDSYNITDEFGNVVFTVKGKFALGHTFVVYDAYGNEVGMLRQQLFTFLPKFEIYINGDYAGRISKRFTFFIPKFTLDYKGWTVDGDFFEWDYSVYDGQRQVMSVSKELLRLTDTYQCNIYDDRDALDAIMIALAIDAEKCSRNN